MAVREQHLQFTDADKSVKDAFLAVRELREARLQNRAQRLRVLRPRLNHQIRRARCAGNEVQFAIVRRVKDPKSREIGPCSGASSQCDAFTGECNGAIGRSVFVEQCVDDADQDRDDCEGDGIDDDAVRHAEGDDDARDCVPSRAASMTGRDGRAPGDECGFLWSKCVHVGVCKNPVSIAEITPFGTGRGLH